MEMQLLSNNILPKLGSYLFNIGILAGIATMAFSLVSCGGGGGGGGGGGSSTSGSTAVSISRMTTISAASSAQARGTLAASSPQALSIFGTNFGSGVSGVTVSIATPGGGTVNLTPSSVTPTKIIANVTILSVPTDRYVTVTVQTATGSSVSGILGVALNYKTISANIQAIFNSNCGGCHVGNPSQQGGLDLRDATKSANTLIEVAPTTCTPSAQYRVKPGDPRRTNNTLIDVIKAKNSLFYVLCQMPSGAVSAVSATDIDAIIDWISLGAI